MLFFILGVLSTGLAVFLLWYLRARDGEAHALLKGWFGSMVPVLLVIMLVFGVSMAVAGIVR